MRTRAGAKRGKCPRSFFLLFSFTQASARPKLDILAVNELATYLSAASIVFHPGDNACAPVKMSIEAANDGRPPVSCFFCFLVVFFLAGCNSPNRHPSPFLRGRESFFGDPSRSISLLVGMCQRPARVQIIPVGPANPFRQFSSNGQIRSWWNFVRFVPQVAAPLFPCGRPEYKSSQSPDSRCPKLATLLQHLVSHNKCPVFGRRQFQSEFKWKIPARPGGVGQRTQRVGQN